MINRRRELLGFKKLAPSVMFAVSYDDGRTAYLVIENHGSPSTDHLVPVIAKQRQDEGILPVGMISRIKRVR